MTDDPIDLAAERGKRKGRKRKAPASPEVSPPADGPSAPPAESPSDPGPCPIQPLGAYDDACYFLDTLGHLRRLTDTALGKPASVIHLFGGSAAAMAFLRNKFPYFSKDGTFTKGFDGRACNVWLVDQCTLRGTFDPARVVRRRYGVFQAGGMTAVHVGNVVFFIGKDGEMKERPSGFMEHGALYESAASVPPPAPPVSAEIAAMVERMFSRWPWAEPGGEKVFMGLFAAGLICGALDWRTHAMIIGPPGVGKSTLLEFFQALAPLAIYKNSYTAASIIQELDGRAVPVLLDEADATDPQGIARLQHVVSFTRLNSSGKGAVHTRGSSDGTARTATLAGSFFLCCVLPPELSQADAERFIKLELIKKADRPPLPRKEMLETATRYAPGLWGRAIHGLPRFRANLEVVRAVLSARGYEARVADRIGTVIAARAMLLEDEGLDVTAAEQDIADLGWLLPSHGAAVSDSGPALCLQHYLDSQADAVESGRRPTVSELIDRVTLPVPDHDAQRTLLNHGAKVAPYPARGGGPAMLLIRRTHQAVRRVYAGSQWADGRWGHDLKRLPGAFEPDDPVKLRPGEKVRVVAVPLDWLPGVRSPESPAPTDAEDSAA
jgi:hypothetical protein